MEIPSPSTVLRHPSVISGHQDTFLASKYRDKINDNFDILFDVDLKVILPKLREKRVITFEHYDDLWEKVHKGQERQAKDEFLRILPTRGRKAYLWFCHILLIKAEQEFLYDLLVDAEARDAIEDLQQSESRDEDHMVPGTDDLRAFLQAESKNTTPMLHDPAQTVPKCVDPPSSVYTEGAVSRPTEESNVTAGGAARGSAFFAAAADDRELTSAVQPSSDADEEDMVEADFPEDDMEFNRPDPAWIEKLRGYQRELAEPGLQGHNYIICAPTGSGKTMVAAYVVYDHLRRTRDRGRVVFFAPTVALVRQQHEEFKGWFSALKVDYLVGPELEEKAEINVMLKNNQVTLMTPAIFENALIEGKVKGLHQVTLMIFDECHHTHSDNMYNRIMGRYVDRKIKLQRGDHDIDPHLPQVIGITASLGVGDARGNDSAVYFVLKKCANLDARQIAVVRRNKEELAKYVHEPTEEMAMIPGRQNDPFARTIVGAMKEIEEKIREIPGTEKVAPSDLEFPDKKDTQVYLSYLSTIMWKIAKLPTGSYTRRRVISCLEYLACYHKALTIHDEARAKDALNLLQRMLDLRGPTVKEDDPTEMWLKEMYSEKWQILTTLSENDRNPKLVALKQMILKAFDEEPESYAILFTRTKNATEALKSWVNEDPDMSHLGALRITGTSSEDTAGMTSKNQQDVVKHFKKGVCRLLIATSVAEEGLDIKACNCVFRYNYTTNEIGRVQSKGRARMEKSSYHTITSADQQHLEDREKMNLYKEGLMRYAVGKISEMDKKNYENQIFELQVMDYKDRRLKEFLLEQKQAMKSKDVFLVCCFKCDEVVCLSEHIVLFGENRYTCIEPDFDDYILVKPHAKPKKIPMAQQLHKVVCKKCKCYWGTIVKYEGKVQLPLLQSPGFTYFTRLDGGWRGDRVCGPAVKKWDDAPCVFERVPEEKVYKHFRGKSYDPVYYERKDLDPELN